MCKDTKPISHAYIDSFTCANNINKERFLLGNRNQSVLLHACCGPCATSCVERLAFDYDLTVFFYNPNITDSEEYFKRKGYLIKFLKEFNEEYTGQTHVNYIEGRYDPEDFLMRAEALKDEPEGGRRCMLCFSIRMSESADVADKIGADYFTTTMSVSPHKNYEALKTIGMSIADNHICKFLDIDFKKRDGFLRSIQLSKKHGLYRQKFCGCEYARAAMN